MKETLYEKAYGEYRENREDFSLKISKMSREELKEFLSNSSDDDKKPKQEKKWEGKKNRSDMNIVFLTMKKHLWLNYHIFF